MRRVILPILIISTLLLSAACAKTISDKEPVVAAEKETVSVQADYPWYDSIEALYDRADLVIEGKVLDSRVEWMNHAIEPSEEDKDDPYLNPGGDTDPGEMITSIYTVEIHDIYKGSAGESIELGDIGGEIGGVVCENPEAADIETGETYLLFLSVYGDFPACLLNPVQAIYRVDGDSLAGTMPLTFADLAYLRGSAYMSIPTIRDLTAPDVQKIEKYDDSAPPDIPSCILEDAAEIQSYLDRLQQIRIIGVPDWPDREEIAPGAWSDYSIYCIDGRVIEMHFLMDRVDFGEGYYPYVRED